MIFSFKNRNPATGAEDAGVPLPAPWRKSGATMYQV
jgi:hypothetical protein